MNNLPLDQIPTPAYICEEAKLEVNLELLARVQREANCQILVALKGFALWKSFPLAKKYLAGGAASGLHEAKLIAEEMPGGQVHTYCPAFKNEEFAEIVEISDHLIFNSFSQWQQFRGQVGQKKCGLRVNPELGQSPEPIYDPCGPTSRLGITRAEFEPGELKGISGLHFHALCEQDSFAFERVLAEFENKFGEFLPQMEWVNFGGGHHITRADYDVAHLIHLIQDFRTRWPNIQNVYLEPGEAVGWQTGELVASIVDIVRNGDRQIAILDASFAAHMPDCLEMPYDPKVRGAGKPGEFANEYLLGGPTCLAGDFIPTPYTFEKPLQIGNKLIFEDMIHYTIVKNNTFNGVKLPSILWLTKNGKLETWHEFGYPDYKNRNS